MKKFLFALALCLLVLPLPAHSGRIDEASIVDYGIYTRGKSKKTKAYKATSGYVNVLDEYTFIEKTDRILIRPGLSFGIAFQTKGLTNLKDEVTVITINPGIKHPKKKRTIYKSEYKKSIQIGKQELVGWTFEDDFEMIPGRWGFKILYDGKVLLEKYFEAYK